jgi:hypothetical protein
MREGYVTNDVRRVQLLRGLSEGMAGRAFKAAGNKSGDQRSIRDDYYL